MTILLSLETMKRSVCLVGIVFALGACATTEATPPTAKETAMLALLETAEATTTSNAESDDSMICKKTTVVGSKFNKRLCATKAEWERQELEYRLATEQIQRVKAPGSNN